VSSPSPPSSLLPLQLTRKRACSQTTKHEAHLNIQFDGLGQQ
jgi:hypothetical protein